MVSRGVLMTETIHWRLSHYANEFHNILWNKYLKPTDAAVTFSGYVFRQAVNPRASLKFIWNGFLQWYFISSSFPAFIVYIAGRKQVHVDYVLVYHKPVCGVRILTDFNIDDIHVIGLMLPVSIIGFCNFLNAVQPNDTICTDILYHDVIAFWNIV